MLTVYCDIVSAEGGMFSGEIKSLIASGCEGDLGIMPGHAPLLTQLKPGPIEIEKTQGGVELFYVSGGFLEIQPNRITVLADTALRADHMDEAAAEAVKQQAEKDIENKSGEFDYSRAVARLAEATAQLRTLHNLRKKLRR